VPIVLRNLLRLNVLCFGLIATILCGGCGKADVSNSEDITGETTPSLAPTSILLEPPIVPPRPSMEFVGSQACKECHAEQFTEFRGHPMGQSLTKTSEAAELEDYTSETGFQVPRAPRSSVTTSYNVDKKDSRVFHHEVMRSKNGEVIYDLAAPIDYSVGSGKRGRSYLINRSGLMFMSPMTWYSGSSEWDLSPGYEHRNLHFSRRIVDGCLSCHSGRVANVEDRTAIYEPVPFIEESIGCEKCHGPGKSHIAFHRQNGTGTENDSIVNPSRLSPRARNHVCFQCHLVGEHRLTRYGRSDFDFRPGDDLSDIWTIFLRSKHPQDTAAKAVSHVEQMLDSVCYKKSGGQLGCVSCHDPHQVPTEPVSFYRAKCVQCHTPETGDCSLELELRLEKSAEDSCVTCHMPAIEANDVPHTAQTDHRIIKHLVLSRPKTEQTSRTLYVFGESEGLIPKAEIQRAQAISVVKAAEKSGNSVLANDAISILEVWWKSVPEDLDAGIALGTAYWLTGDPRMASKTWEAMIKREPENEDLLRRLQVLCHETNQLQMGADYGRKLIKVSPWNYEYFGRHAHMLGSLGLYEEAIIAAERALELNPTELQLHQWLAEIHEYRKNVEKAKYHRRQLELKSAR
jgi:hypothetical protein